MIYALSDLHGCYGLYLKALALIDFKDEDTLYILGDVCDRGIAPMQILLDMQQKHNIIPLFGNHDYIALSLLEKIFSFCQENNEVILSENELISAGYWLSDGGQTTLDGYSKLTTIQQKEIIKYLKSFKMYQEIEVNHQKYLLVHAGLNNFKKNKSIDSYTDEELLFDRLDYSKTYFSNKILVTGHTPTLLIDEKYRNKIYIKNNNIGLDCGAVFLKTLGIYCFDTQKCYYVKD